MGSVAMTNVVLIGDSIRRGYEPSVRAALAGAATFAAPLASGGTTDQVLSHIRPWALDRSPAVVHVNAGLHDLARDFDEHRPRVPLERYKQNVSAILMALLAPGGLRPIWATATPVNEAWHHERKSFDRLEADVQNYNTVAVSVARELDVTVNDLYAVVMSAGRDDLLLDDGVHFRPEGYALLGRAVAGAIRAAL